MGNIFMKELITGDTTFITCKQKVKECDNQKHPRV